jgi:hypothetical protein
MVITQFHHFVHIFIFKSGCENLAVLLMKIQVFWDVVTACPLLNGYQMTWYIIPEEMNLH